MRNEGSRCGSHQLARAGKGPQWQLTDSAAHGRVHAVGQACAADGVAARQHRGPPQELLAGAAQEVACARLLS